MRLKAPAISGSTWLNTPQIHQDMFFGRVTAVVFWSIHCESSARILTLLEDRQRTLGSVFAVIAVHSPRFVDQTDTALVRSHVDQMRLRLPIVHDPALDTWGLYDPPGWPTIMLIDHNGRVIGSLAGAPDDTIDEAIQTALADARRAQSKKGQVPRPLPVPDVPSTTSLHELRFPSGVAGLPCGRLAVVDSGNNRVLIGSIGQTGFTVETTLDGFDRPARVVAIDRRTIAVSEPVNGRVMLATHDDELSVWPLDLSGLEPPLCRPVGLGRDRDGSLVVADAGADTIIRVIDAGLQNQTHGPIAGTTRRSEIFQPVDIEATETGLAFCELATSRLRLLTHRSSVLTSSSTAGSSNAGEVGLVDGPLHKALFDRPSALVSLDDGTLVVIDQGSGRLRSVLDRHVTTLGLVPLSAPADATTIDGSSLIVADTHAHRLVHVDRQAKKATPIAVSGLVPRVHPFDFGPASRSDDFALFHGDEPPITVTTVPAVDPSQSLEDLTAISGSPFAVRFPALGAGPWTVTVTAEPSSLIEAPVTVVRTVPEDDVSVMARTPGHGSLIVMVSGSDDGHRAVKRHTVEVRASNSSIETKTIESAPF